MEDIVPLRTKFEVIEDETLPKEYTAPMTMTKQPIDRNMSELQASTVTVVPKHRVGPRSSLVDCPYCHACVKTTVEHTTTTRTHILATLLCITFCCLCACCTYCRDSARNSDHYCPNCTRFLGTYKK